MVGWLERIFVAVAIVVALWALLAAQLPAGLLKDLAGFLSACVTLARRLRTDPRVPWRAKAAVVMAGRAAAAGAAPRPAGRRSAATPARGQRR